MRIVAHLPLYPPASRVGAWLSTHECLAALVAAGHQVDAIPYLGGPPASYGYDGVQVHPEADLEPFAAQADVIVSHLGDAGVASATARRLGVPSVRMVHGTPTAAHQLADDLVVFNSESLAARVAWAGRQIVVRPPVDPELYRTTPGNLVTLVNLSADKGGHVFWSVARRMPDVKFLGVRGCHGTQIVKAPRPNVEVIPPTMSMAADVYSRTAVLLMPSKNETWGRTGIEAAVSGIPTIAHPTPGLRESLGASGTFVDRNDTPGWVAAIRRLISDVDAWEDASEAARARAAQLGPAADLARFVEAVTDLAAVPA